MRNQRYLTALSRWHNYLKDYDISIVEVYKKIESDVDIYDFDNVDNPTVIGIKNISKLIEDLNVHLYNLDSTVGKVSTEKMVNDEKFTMYLSILFRSARESFLNHHGLEGRAFKEQAFEAFSKLYESILHRLESTKLDHVLVDGHIGNFMEYTDLDVIVIKSRIYALKTGESNSYESTIDKRLQGEYRYRLSEPISATMSDLEKDLELAIKINSISIESNNRIALSKTIANTIKDRHREYVGCRYKLTGFLGAGPDTDPSIAPKPTGYLPADVYAFERAYSELEEEVSRYLKLYFPEMEDIKGLINKFDYLGVGGALDDLKH